MQKNFGGGGSLAMELKPTERKIQPMQPHQHLSIENKSQQWPLQDLTTKNGRKFQLTETFQCHSRLN